MLRTMLRTVSVPAGVAGRLFLHGMPGRNEPFASAKAEIVQTGVDRVVCLAPLDEVQQKSPDYACAIEQGALPWAHDAFEVPDYQAPQDQRRS